MRERVPGHEKHGTIAYAKKIKKGVGAAAAGALLAGGLSGCVGGASPERLASDGVQLSAGEFGVIQARVKARLEGVFDGISEGRYKVNKGDGHLSLKAVSHDGPDVVDFYHEPSSNGSIISVSVLKYRGSEGADNSTFITFQNPSDDFRSAEITPEGMESFLIDPKTFASKLSGIINVRTLGGEEGMIEATYGFNRGEVVTYRDTSMGRNVDAPTNGKTIVAGVDEMLSRTAL